EAQKLEIRVTLPYEQRRFCDIEAERREREKKGAKFEGEAKECGTERLSVLGFSYSLYFKGCECERRGRGRGRGKGVREGSWFVAYRYIIAMERKLVVLGIPWDVDTNGLKEYMIKFGELEDCIVMKRRGGRAYLGRRWRVGRREERRRVRRREGEEASKEKRGRGGEGEEASKEKRGELSWGWGWGWLREEEGEGGGGWLLERNTGRSRGFGYVTFVSDDDAKKALSSEHQLGNRVLEVKVATPKEEMMRSSSKKITRIFVARIAPSVSESMFRSHFEKYGEITDLYMPKDPTTKGHRGIGFITFGTSDSVDNLMNDTHELGGSTVVVDRATPKEDDFRPFSRVPHGGGRGGHGGGHGGYGAYNAYISAATRYAALGTPTLYDGPGSLYGREPMRGIGRKIFVGRLSQEATVDDLRQYFGRFGRILDVYIPKDPKRSGHRGFGFVTFAEDGVADRVARRSHEILGQPVAIDSATPVDDAGPSGSLLMDNPEPPPYGGYGPMRGGYGRMYSSLDFDDVSMITVNYGVAAMASAVQGLPEQTGGTDHIRVVSSNTNKCRFVGSGLNFKAVSR
ncbi:Heterogeneous nuclear ribonucleoprotein A1-like 2, partial [Bienertia sinuspersici]